MKILFLSGMGQGGAQRQVKELIELMISEKHTVHLATYNKKNIFYNLPKEITIIELADYKTPRLLRKLKAIFVLRKILIHNNYDVAISFITKMNITLSIASSFFENNTTKFIASDRSTNLSYSNKTYWFLLAKIFYKRFNLIITNIESNVAKIHDTLNISLSKIVYLPNYVNSNQFSLKYQNYLNNTKKKTVLIPARFSKQKNQMIVYEILKYNEIQFVEFLFIGSNDTFYGREFKNNNNFSKYIKQLKVIDSVINIQDYYMLSDIVFLPSLYEGTPNVILEAMTCGKVCVVSNIPEHQSIIIDGVNGFLVDIENVESLTGKLISILNMSTLDKQRIGLNASKSVSDYSDKKLYYNKLINVINLALKDN